MNKGVLVATLLVTHEQDGYFVFMGCDRCKTDDTHNWYQEVRFDGQVVTTRLLCAECVNTLSGGNPKKMKVRRIT